MATPIASNFTRLTSADLLKFKRYLIEQVSRSMEGEQLQFGDQSEIVKAALEGSLCPDENIIAGGSAQTDLSRYS